MASLNKITLHYTGGTYKPNSTDKEAYHYLIDGDGVVHPGKYKPFDNINTKDGKYARHCGGGNTGNIGVAICCMWDKDYPIKRIQLEAMCKLVASLSFTHGVPITSKTIFTHAEFGESHPSSTSKGKQDFVSLPCVAVYGTKQCGEWFRNKIKWYKERI
jgi:hypothetical protein